MNGWILIIGGGLLFVVNSERANRHTEDGATALVWSVVGAALTFVGILYAAGVAS